MDNHGEPEHSLPRELDEAGRPGDRTFSGSTGEEDHRGHDGDSERRDVRRKFRERHRDRETDTGVELCQGVFVLSHGAHDDR